MLIFIRFTYSKVRNKGQVIIRDDYAKIHLNKGQELGQDFAYRVNIGYLFPRVKAFSNYF